VLVTLYESVVLRVLFDWVKVADRGLGERKDVAQQ
jgi:hypothetical protein